MSFQARDGRAVHAGAPVPPERLRWCSEVCLVSHRVEQATDKQREQRQRQRVAA